MTINVITDVYSGVTKNFLHLIVGVILSVLVIGWGEINTLFAVLVGLVAGIGIRKVNGFYGSGDIKMLVVLSLAICYVYDYKSLFLFYLCYLTTSLIHMNVLVVIRKIGYIFRFGGYEISKEILRVPEAVPLLIGLTVHFKLFN